MSRRRSPADDVNHVFVALYLSCRKGHHLGKIVRQHGQDLVEWPLERIDGPNGESKIRAVCKTCAALDASTDSQMRWDKITALLDGLQAGPGRNYERNVAMP